MHTRSNATYQVVRRTLVSYAWVGLQYLTFTLLRTVAKVPHLPTPYTYFKPSNYLSCELYRALAALRKRERTRKRKRREG